MKRVWTATARAAMVTAALAFAACTTSGGTTGSGTGTTDTATATDTAATDGTAAKTDGSATDTGTGGGDGSVGTELPKPDTSSPDTTKDVPPAVQKCSPTDQMCMNGCSQSACAKESGACVKDPKCTKLGPCLQACEKAELPSDPTATACGKKCLDDAGETATKAFYAGQACLGEKCITCKTGDQNCAAACASQLCIEQLAGCQADAGCTLILDCITKNKCQDQGCLQTCVGKFPTGAAALNGFFQCFQANAAACNE